MKLQILGTGCAKCKALTQATEQAAQALGLPYELEKVTDLNQIMSFGVMLTPALAVDGRAARMATPRLRAMRCAFQRPASKGGRRDAARLNGPGLCGCRMTAHGPMPLTPTRQSILDRHSARS